MNQSVELPFPMIWTEIDGTIASFNLSAKTLWKDLEAGRKLENIFEVRDRKDNFLVGFCGEKPYVLIEEQIIENQHTRHLYHITSGAAYMELTEKMKKLDDTNRELDTIIESSFDGFYITDKEGNTLKANSAIERITGIPKEYYLGKNIKDLMNRGILKESVTVHVLEKKETVSLVQKNVNGKETLLTGSPIFNEEGEIEKIVTNVRDLTELNTLLEELNKVQKLNEQYKHELDRLKAHTKQDPDLILKSEAMLDLFQIAERLANVDTTVLITGETGVGKDVLARHLYLVSNRYDSGKLIKINCGAIPKDLLESELFGYESGAFSGASRAGKPGMFELADRGFLFLDEVGEMPLDLQVKLLRVLQEKEIQRVGGTKVKKVDVRVIAATNKDLKQLVKDGLFREDLYYRLHVVPVRIPPLRERKDDILPLLQYFVDSCNKKYDMEKSFDRDLKDFFYGYTWPGNVRELANLVERLMLTVPSKTLTFEDLPEDYRKKEATRVDSYPVLVSLKEAVEQAEKNILCLAMQSSKSTYEIAEKLGTSQPTVVRKLKKYELSAIE